MPAIIATQETAVALLNIENALSAKGDLPVMKMVIKSDTELGFE